MPRCWVPPRPSLASSISASSTASSTTSTTGEAHQFLDQLDGQARQTLLSNASVKIVGGVSYKDNQTFAREMNTDTGFLSSLSKHESSTEFCLWIKNVIPDALKLSVPFGLLESAKLLDDTGQQLLLDQNRELFCVPSPQKLAAHRNTIRQAGKQLSRCPGSRFNRNRLVLNESPT